MYDYDGCLPPYIQVFSPLFYVAGHDCMTTWPMSGRKSAMGKLKLHAHTAKPKAHNSIAGNVTKSTLQCANHDALDIIAAAIYIKPWAICTAPNSSEESRIAAMVLFLPSNIFLMLP